MERTSVPGRLIAALAAYGELIKVEHTVFALPFAVAAMVLAADGWPGWRTFLLVVAAVAAARTAAMTFNRLADLSFDACNPRTSGRPLVTGRVSRLGAGLLLAASSGAFIIACAFLNRTALRLSVPALAVVLAYSCTKRFTVASHLVLGASLALAPLGAWIAVDGRFHAVPILLAAGVVLWVAGFDIIYSTMDVDFDRRMGLRSIPARYGVGPALLISALVHLLAAACFAATLAFAGLGIFSWAAAAIAGLFLLWQHLIVRPSDLSRVNTAFFTLNGFVSILLMIGILADVLRR